MKGHLRKMILERGEEVSYSLVLDNEQYPLVPHLGDKITITYLGDIHCQACGKSTHKSYNQGYCYRCFQILAANDHCVMAPEHCHYDNGTCREPEWGEKHCMQPHIVYLSWTSGLKVGLTKPHNPLNRWMDQGATHAVALCQVPTRHQAGLLEDHLRNWYHDRTNWKGMLQMEFDDRIDLIPEAEKVLEKVNMEYTPLPLSVETFHYPIHAVGPIQALTLDKQRTISGCLLGMKGQYLILDTGVINIRKHTSYLVEVTIERE